MIEVVTLSKQMNVVHGTLHEVSWFPQWKEHIGQKIKLNGDEVILHKCEPHQFQMALDPKDPDRSTLLIKVRKIPTGTVQLGAIYEQKRTRIKMKAEQASSQCEDDQVVLIEPYRFGKSGFAQTWRGTWEEFEDQWELIC